MEEFHDEPNTFSTPTRQQEKMEIANIGNNRNSSNIQDEEEEEEEIAMISIRQRFWYELLRCDGFFDLREYDNDVSIQEGRMGTFFIDLTMTLAPDYSPWKTFIYKMLFLSISVEILIQSLAFCPKNQRHFFMAYLTDWGLVISILYQLLAVLCITHRLFFILSTSRQERWQNGDSNDVPSSRMTYRLPNRLSKWTWGVYSLVLPMQLIIAILFWGLDYSQGDPITYEMCIKHGGIAFFLWLDGSYMSVIPIRIRHYIFLQVVVLLYITWSIIFAFSDIPNPNQEDDDFIYDTLRWVSQPEKSTILAILCGFVLPPLVFAGCWLFSSWSGLSPTSWCQWDGSRRCLYQGHSRLDPAELEMVTSSVS